MVSSHHSPPAPGAHPAPAPAATATPLAKQFIYKAHRDARGAGSAEQGNSARGMADALSQWEEQLDAEVLEAAR
jgi:hypothetical protein